MSLSRSYRNLVGSKHRSCLSASCQFRAIPPRHASQSNFVRYASTKPPSSSATTAKGGSAAAVSRSRHVESHPKRTTGPVIRSSGRNTSSTPSAARAAPAPASTTQTPSPTTDAVRAAEQREMQLRWARIRRQDERKQQMEEEERKKQAKREYQEKYNTKARKWTSSIIALPILLVTTYYLVDRCEYRLIRERWLTLDC